MRRFLAFGWLASLTLFSVSRTDQPRRAARGEAAADVVAASASRARRGPR
jgi:hypothetical protein